MQKTSTKKVLLRQDRNGRIEEHIRIKIWQDKKDPDLKVYTIKTADYIVRDLGAENESLELNKDNYGNEQIKSYQVTYEDYETQKADLLLIFSTELTGSELDDYLLLKKLEISLNENPVYGLTGEEWI